MAVLAAKMLVFGAAAMASARSHRLTDGGRYSSSILNNGRLLAIRH